MTKYKFISKAEFCEVCKYVCYQLVPSGSEELDKEALNFAIYWQFCNIFDERIFSENNFYSKTSLYQYNLQKLLKNRTIDSFDAIEIVDKSVEEGVSTQYREQPEYDYAKHDWSNVLLSKKIPA